MVRYLYIRFYGFTFDKTFILIQSRTNAKERSLMDPTEAMNLSSRTYSSVFPSSRLAILLTRIWLCQRFWVFTRRHFLVGYQRYFCEIINLREEKDERDK